MSGIPRAMALLQSTFDEHAGKDGDPNSLSKNELSEMLHSAFPNAVGPDFDGFFKKLDCDGDGVVNFEEYVTFIAAIVAMSKTKK